MQRKEEKAFLRRSIDYRPNKKSLNILIGRESSMKLLKKTAAALCAALTISAAASAAPLAPELQVDALA